MPVIVPFRGLAYAPTLRDRLGRLIAPPYDVLDAAARADLEARDRNNVVHLDLPRVPPGEDPYAAAATLLQTWRRDGVLERDQEAALYPCAQTFRGHDGTTRLRRGFFARLRLEDFGSGVVLPHERTLDRPREDRRRLLAATHTHLSAVFLLHADPDGAVRRILDIAGRDTPWGQARGDDGEVRIGRLPAGPHTEEIVRSLADGWALIADGHHRYEAALAYRDERRALGRRDAEHVLGYFCSLGDPGLAILPIHRLVHSLPSFEGRSFLRDLAALFEIEPLHSAAALRDRLARQRGRPGAFGLAVRGESGFFLACWKEGAGLDGPGLSAVPTPLRRLDVILLHRLVLERILGIDEAAQARQVHLTYVKDEASWFAEAPRPSTALGVLMNPTSIEQVLEVTRGGLRLPQKSTYFHPKVPTGLILDPLES